MIFIENLYKTYKMGSNNININALNGIDLYVKQSEYIAIMGASGSGKSTLMNIIGCLDTPTSGTYTLKSQRIDKLDDDKLSDIRNASIGFVFQSFNLLPRLSAKNNITLPLKYSSRPIKNLSERVLNLLKLVGLGKRAEHKPSELSGGERQRVAIARAIINNPDIILADEPTGNLDSASAMEIMKVFKRLHNEGQTIIMVTHDQKIADNAQRIIELSDGKIVNDYKKT